MTRLPSDQAAHACAGVLCAMVASGQVPADWRKQAEAAVSAWARNRPEGDTAVRVLTRPYRDES